ncbi:hypothetical protein ScPMuIL_005688 [Solemya velum]
MLETSVDHFHLEQWTWAAERGGMNRYPSQRIPRTADDSPRGCTPRLYFKDSALAKHLLKKCRLLSRPFSPPLWLRNRHVQTILPVLLPTPLVEFDREYILMKDKGVVALDWFVRIKSNRRKRLVFLIVIPGMTDSTLDVANVCKLGAKKGFRPLVFNFRGHGKTVLTTPKLQSYGDPSDLRQIIKYIKERYPKGIISAVGYGTGCDLLLSYLGEYGSSASISGAVCISPCYDVTDRFTKTVDGLYDFFYMLRLKNILCCHSKSLSKNIDLSRAIQTWSFQEYYQSVYSKLYGFSDMEEFWDRNNPLRDVDDISVPVMFINSLDDPFYSKK